MSGTVDTMVGLVPVAIAGGLTIGLTRKAMEIPGSVSSKPRKTAPKKRKPIARKRKTTRRKKSKK